MAAELTHPEVEELLGAYALDAVDPDEAEAIERYLRDCPRCRAEVAAHREVAAVLAQAGSSAPAGVWDRIAGELEEPPPRLDLAPVRRLPSARSGGGLWTRVAAVAAVAATMAAGVLGVEVVRQDRRVDDLVAAVQRSALEDGATAALMHPGARQVRLASSDGQVGAQAVLLPDGTGYLVRNDLPALHEGLTYQLWGVVGGRRVSLGVLGRDPAVRAFTYDGGVTALAVTTEAAGGVSDTDKTPVVSGAVATA